MSIQEHHCVTISCDGCGLELQHEEGFTPHWASADEARQAVTDDAGGYDGWQLTDDGKDLCGLCVIRRDHEANGHDWGEWMPVESSGIAGLERRFCIYFDGGEQYRRHGQPLTIDTVRALLNEVRASSERGERS